MNILCVSIPTLDLVSKLIVRYGYGFTLYVNEMRPFEAVVSSSLKDLEKINIYIVILTDNMNGALFQNCQIDAVYSVFIRLEGENYLCPAGALMAAILCEQYKSKFYLTELLTCDTSYYIDFVPGKFFGENICESLDGVNVINYQWDTVNKTMVSEFSE
jgi:methylthioribose-1-phosphate isomerase